MKKHTHILSTSKRKKDNFVLLNTKQFFNGNELVDRAPRRWTKNVISLDIVEKRRPSVICVRQKKWSNRGEEFLWREMERGFHIGTKQLLMNQLNLMKDHCNILIRWMNPYTRPSSFVQTVNFNTLYNFQRYCPGQLNCFACMQI